MAEINRYEADGSLHGPYDEGALVLWEDHQQALAEARLTIKRLQARLNTDKDQQIRWLKGHQDKLYARIAELEQVNPPLRDLNPRQ